MVPEVVEGRLLYGTTHGLASSMRASILLGHAVSMMVTCSTPTSTISPWNNSASCMSSARFLCTAIQERGSPSEYCIITLRCRHEIRGLYTHRWLEELKRENREYLQHLSECGTVAMQI